VREPRGDLLVHDDVKEFQVGPVRPGPDPVPGVRPAQRGGQQRQMAGSDHDLIKGAERQVASVPAPYTPDLLETRSRATGQVLDIDKVQSALRKPFPAAR
jgi:hypothetical protein